MDAVRHLRKALQQIAEEVENSGNDCRQIAATALASMPSERAASTWISVDDRLPEEGESVALVNIHRFESMGGAEENRNVHDVGYLSTAFGVAHWSIRGERAKSIIDFTHWMPLPAAPVIATNRQKGHDE